MHPKSILALNSKGGVGKTTCVLELCYAAARSGILFSMYSLDRQPGDHEDIEDPQAVVNIIDTPGALTDDLVEWMRRADLIVVPTKMSARDLPPLLNMRDLIHRMGIEVPVIYIFNCWTRYKVSADFELFWHSHFPEDTTITLPQSEMILQAGMREISVCDYRARSFVADQVDAMVMEVERQLHVGFKSYKVTGPVGVLKDVQIVER